MRREILRSSLAELIERMSQFEQRATSAMSVSWHAHREAEQLNDVTMAREIDSYLRENPAKERRSAAYFIVGKIGKNCLSPECAAILIGHLAREKDKDALTSLLRALAEMPKAAHLDLAPIFALLHDKRRPIRHAAIQSLINTASAAAEEQVLEVLRVSTDPRDVVDCHATLNRIGTVKALPALEAGLRSRKRDVKGSAKAAIEAIAERDSSRK